MKIREMDVPVLHAFLIRESQNFRQVTNNNEWADERLGIILRELKRFRVKADFIIIESLTSLGHMEAKLCLPCPNFDWKKNIRIYLCPCGKRDCWGGISVEGIGEGRWKN